MTAPLLDEILKTRTGGFEPKVRRIDTPYQEFISGENIPIHEVWATPSFDDLETQPWERIGGKGCYIHYAGRGPSNAYITEIAPKSALKVQRHLYDETIFVIEGSGQTTLWNDSGFESTYPWQRGTTFAIPLNVHFRHTNTTGEPARLYSVTNQPMMMDVFSDPEFIFDCPRDFSERFSQEVTDPTRPADPNCKDTFNHWAHDEDAPNRSFRGDLVPNAYDVALTPHYRTADGLSLSMDLGHSTLRAHIGQFAPETYWPAHRHGPGAYVIILSGTGYTLVWKDETDIPDKIDWQPGAVFVPPDGYFHQHFNTTGEPARYLALKLGRKVIMQDTYDIGRSTREGGDEISFEDEDPRLRALFEATLAS